MTATVQSVGDAMEAHILAQEVAAFNVANIATPGFKRQVAIMESMEATEGETTASGAVATSVDFSSGDMVATGNDLDFAIGGKGFFTVEGPDREHYYTRNGSFRFNDDRTLITQLGHPVLNEGGMPITIPEGSDPLVMHEDGSLRAGLTSLGKFGVVEFSNPELLQPVGGCEFKEQGAGPVASSDSHVQQRVLERSNVHPVTELVRMISSLRDYTACARSLKALEESASKLYSWAGG